MRVFFVFVCLFSLLAPSVHADTLSELAGHPRWQALLHINPGATLRGVGDSYVDDDAFFLAANGKQDPLAELEATVEALREPGAAARCRFPARYRFVAGHLGWRQEDPFSHCREYLAWREQMPTGQLVLVFPASYLNSPSSMFGHTLLRLDETPDPPAVWLSKAINFGAQVNPDDNSIFYIWRGLAGGYPGRFSIVPYVTKIQEYAHLENRDMWEYALNLDRQELEWVVRHLWELRDVNFDYYFFDENCSFRLLELIKVARPDAPLMEGFRVAEVPVNTVRALYRSDLVAERRYRPSKAVELDHLAGQLRPGERELAQRLLEDPSLAESEAFRALPARRRHLVASVAYQAIRFHHRREARDAEVAERSLRLLRIMQRNPAPEHAAPPEPAPPEAGHGTKMVSIAGGQRQAADFGELGWRFTYHDVLDPITGFLPGAGIEGLDLRLRSTESEEAKLEQLDVVEIRSLSPRGTFVKPISWFVHGGLERARVGDRRELLRFVQGGPGLSWQWGRFLPYGLLAARVENTSGWTPFLETGGGAELGLLYHAPSLQLGATVSGIYFENDEYRHESSLTINLPLSRNHALRGECKREGWRGDGVNECRLGYRFFFD